MYTRFKKNCLHLAVVAGLGLAMPAIAQNTSSGITGQLENSTGRPVDNATITIVHTPSNSVNVINSNENGRFSAKGLRVGGPYTVTVESSEGKRVIEDVFLTLGQNFSLNLEIGTDNLEEVFVVGNYEQAKTATGPSSAFNISDLQNAPAVNRDIKDVVRLDPRIYIDEANADDITCAGANPRFNSLTVDGVRMNDNFGLNSNGYPTERIPFSFDAIDQVAVELAPFDVQYGGFTACNINAVTKSGDNEFHGGAFFDFTGDSLRGDSLEGQDIDPGDFTEKRYGFTLGGPIIKDKLFFFVAYEELDGAELFNRGPAGSSRATPVEGVSQAQVDEILQISRDVYDYDPGGLPASIPVEDEKLLLKVDWNINDDHRAAFTYNYNDGFTIAEADGDSNELEFSNHYYERGSEFTNYVAQVFSDWTSNFSTEIKLGYSELENRQLSLAGTDFGEVQIQTENNGARATVYLGADDSRHANSLSYESTIAKLAGTYLAGNNTITFGYEYEEFDVFNLFIQEAEGEYRFSNIEDFRNGTPSRITYENAAITNNKNDAAAEFSYAINTLYVQDEIALDSVDLTITAGLRYDWYTTSDSPTLNPDFQAAYGFGNTADIDGLDLIQPRLGFDWQVNDAMEVHGGIGLYTGGNPNVWLSNNYSNDGVTQIEVQDRSGRPIVGPGAIAFNGGGRAIYDVPQELFDQVEDGNGRTGGVNLLDPNFDIPKSWKYAIGTSYNFENGILLSGDLLISDNKDAAIVRDLSRVQVGTAPDGRPLYGSSNGREQDFVLTNVVGDSGSSTVVSLGVAKSFDFGLDVSFGYAYTDAEDVSPMTSSVAFSNYANLATADPENPGLATTNYQIQHRFTLKLDYGVEFFNGYETRFTVFGSANEGRPYSYVFDGEDRGEAIFGDSVGFVDRHLLYVPTGLDDPNVVFDPDFDSDAFFAFVDSEGLARGGIAGRNSLKSDWWIKFDVRAEQELPGFRADHKASVFAVIENFGNFLNDDWGVQYETSFPRAQAAVDAGINNQGQYVFNDFIQPAGQTRVGDASLWELRIGVDYKF